MLYSLTVDEIKSTENAVRLFDPFLLHTLQKSLEM